MVVPAACPGIASCAICGGGKPTRGVSLTLALRCTYVELLVLVVLSNPASGPIGAQILVPVFEEWSWAGHPIHLATFAALWFVIRPSSYSTFWKTVLAQV